MVDHNSAALSVCDFILGRLSERVAHAEQVGDDPARHFATRSRETLQQMRRDLDARPWARHEIENYLIRTARQHRKHPDYQSWWG